MMRRSVNHAGVVLRARAVPRAVPPRQQGRIRLGRRWCSVVGDAVRLPLGPEAQLPRAEVHRLVHAQVAKVFQQGRHAPGGVERPSLYFAFPEQQHVVSRVALSVYSMLYTGEYGAGDAGATIVAKRGCGKSATLRALGPAIQDVFGDRVIHVYLDLKGGEQGVQADLLLRSACKQVEERVGISNGEGDGWADAPVHTLRERLLALLKQHDAYMVLVLDEFDEFYAQELDAANTTLVSSALMDIALLGEGVSGRTFTVLCGSSAWLEVLAFGQRAFPEVVAAYPVAALKRDLNGRKFKVHEPFHHALTPALVERVVPCVEHFCAKMGLEHPYHGALARDFMLHMTRGVLLLAGTHIDGIKLLVHHAAEQGTVEFLGTDTVEEARSKVALCLFSAYTAHREASPDTGPCILGRPSAPAVVVDDYTGVSPLVDCFEFAWAEKNGLHRHTDDGLQQLEWMLESFDAVCDRLAPLDTAEFAVVWKQARMFGLSAQRSKIGSHLKEHTLKYMRRHWLAGQDNRGRLHPMCVFGATMAPRGTVTSLFDKLAVAMYPDACVADARMRLLAGGARAAAVGVGAGLVVSGQLAECVAAVVKVLL